MDGRAAGHTELVTVVLWPLIDKSLQRSQDRGGPELLCPEGQHSFQRMIALSGIDFSVYLAYISIPLLHF